MDQKKNEFNKQNEPQFGAGFKPVSPKVDFPKLEEEMLAYWKKNRVFEKSVELRPKDKTWTFLDGPPFITGLPHYGSLLSSIPKDVFPRFWTMKGYRVRRVWGWDCHGLPAENKVEEKLGIKRKKDIEEKVGVKKFIDECKLYVSQVSSEWEWYVDHIGRWVDFKNAYKTMDLSYMESVMWVFKKMYEGGFIYKGLRVSLYCPHCSTPISNFEVAMDADNYKTITEPANVYKYQLKDKTDTFLLAWSTTPWNKLVTPALAVNPKLTYVKVQQGNEKYILAKSTLKMLKTEPSYKILSEFKGEDIAGNKFIPHYDFYEIEKGKKAFIVAGADFVTADEGTGVVTIAAYGEDDLSIMQKENIQIVMHLDDEGMIKKEVPKWAGMYYLKVNPLVNEDLNKRGLLYREDPYQHTVPTCWRCHTRLVYTPQDAWYVDVQKLKPAMKKTNEKVNWFPKHFKYGRFLKSMEAAPDWCISRSRYWGSPVPVWECGCGERFVPGSIQELEELSGRKISDLHKPEIDEIEIGCKKCGKKVKRVPEVLDSWIEAGSASFGERHYPFGKLRAGLSEEKLEDFYPPDFIGEYTGQIRAWFYVLHVIANALNLRKDGLNMLAKNVLVEGVILGTDGRKMSKNYGNYPDPKEMLQKYGGDALRLYLLGSPVMRGEDILIAQEPYRNQVRGMMLILWNVYNFFITYANLDKWDTKNQKSKGKSKNILDRWIVSRLNVLIKVISLRLENYDTPTSIAYIHKFVEELSTWYVRRSRDRVGPSAEDKIDKDNFYKTAFEVLTTLAKVIAPFTPFLSEEIYRNLTGEESVHLASWPKFDEKLIDLEVEKEMMYVRQLVEQVHAQRKEMRIRVRQPLNSLATISPVNFNTAGTASLIQDEVNVRRIDVKVGNEVRLVNLDTVQTDELKAEGEARDIIRQIQEERKKLGTRLDEKIDVVLQDWPAELEETIKKKALVRSLKKGEKFAVLKI